MTILEDRALLGGIIGATTFRLAVSPFIPPPGGGSGGSGGGGTGSSGGTGSGSGLGSGTGGGIAPPLIQPLSVPISTEAQFKNVSGVGATEDPGPKAVMAHRTFARGEQPNTVVQELPTVPAEPLSLPVRKVLAVSHKLAERLTRLVEQLERGVQERESQTHLVGRVASFSGMALSAGFVV